MSRVRTELSVVQFQVQARDANAALESMQNRASELRGEIDSVQQKIKAIGDVEVETPELIGYKNQLSQLERKLKDVINAQRELTKGVRAADKVWKAAQTGTMEQLTIKELKAGERGVRARMQNLSPGNADDAKTLRAYNAVLEETRIAIRGFEGEVQHVLQTIHDGGNVSADMLKRAKDGLLDLMNATAQGTKEWNDYRLQLDEVNHHQQQQIDAERRLRGEIVNANDAREAAKKLTKEGAEAARQASLAHEEEIKASREKIAGLAEQRDAKEAEARATSEAIVETDKLIAKNQQEIDATKESIKADKKKTEADRQKAELARKTAEQAKVDYETQKEVFEKESAVIEGLTDKVGKLNGKLQALGTQSVKPQVDTSEVEELVEDITSLDGTIEELKKQREKLTAVQTAGAEAAKKDGEAIKMSAEEAQAALDKRKEKSTVTLRGDNGLELSNPAEFFNRVKAFILKANPDSGNYEYHGETGFQTANKEQLKKVAKNVAETYGFKDEYGRDDISAAMEVLRRFSLGKSGGPIKGGAFDKNQGILQLAFDPETWKAYVDESKELFAITKGVTQATDEQSAANERNAQSAKELAEIEEQKATIDQQIALLKSQRKEKQEKLNQLQQQSIRDTEEEERLQKEISSTTADLNQKIEEHAKTEEKLNAAKERSIEADKEVAVLQEQQNQNSDENAKKLKELQDNDQALNAQREKSVETLKEQNKETEQLNQQIGAEATKMQEAEQKKAQAQELTADNIRRAIAVLEEENKTLSDSNPQWVENERLIAQYNQRLEEMKRKSDELRREPVTEMMQQRIQNIGNLSNDAVAETRKFWQAMYDGAERNDPKLKEIEQNLKAINAEEQKRNAGALKESAGKLLGDITTLSEGELRKSIEAAKEYQKTLVVGEEEHRKYSEAIVVAENRISKFGVEAERASQRQAESIQLMQDQLGKGDALTESALKAQINYWQRLADDPKEAAENVALYRKNMEQAKSLLDEMSAKAIQESAGNLLGDITTLSEGELRKSIEAAKEYQKTLVVGEDEHKKYSQAIIEAEEHLEQFGLKAERAAKKQADAMNEMESTLTKAQSGEFSTASIDELTKAIKLLKEYQALIKDPNGAGKDTFEATRTQVEALSSQLESLKGNAVKTKTAFASADEVIQRFNEHSGGGGQPAARAAYEEAVAEEEKLSAAEKARYESRSERMRMTREEIKQGIKLLEEEAMAQDRTTTDGKQRWAELRQVIEDMNRELLEASGDMMSLTEAEKIASEAGTNTFAYTSQQIQAATKALDYQRESIIKTIRYKKDLGESTKKEEQQLEDLTTNLRKLKFEQDNFNVSQEKMYQLMESPKQAVNLDELRAAIKRADGELHLMQKSLGGNSEEYEEFAKQVKNAKAVLKGMEDQAKATNNVWAQAWSRLKTYVGMYMGFNAVWQRITGTMGDLMELSDKMGEVRKTTGFTADEVGRLSMNLKKLDVRTSLTDLMNISASAGQLGLKTIEDVQGFTEAANKMMIALPEMGQEAATEIMRVAIATGEVDKIRKQLDGTVEGSNATAVAMEKIASTVDRLRASSASTAPEITDFIKRVGAIGAQSGISIDQIAALGSTISSLGMRVEMSATALSRMIPAIRNNAFDLAQVLGVTPDSIRQLFDAGRGMEVIMMILQHIKDNNMDENSIEALLGMGGMQEIMKELNQQGARAGIVFAGLSQNVDELRKHLGIAKTAYEENIAIQEEFDKMNETTAAKWERLKNQVEEAFVSDSMQSTLGVIIDYLRDLVDILTGNVSGALRSVNVLLYTFATYWGVLKLGLGGALLGLKNMGSALGSLIKNTKQAIIYSKLLSRAQNEQAATAVRARAAQNGLNKAMVANIWVAVTAAVIAATIAIYNWATSVKTGKKVQAEANAEIDKARDRFEGYFNAIKQTSNTLQTVNAQHSKLSAEVEKLRKSTDDSAEATEKLKKKEEELKKSTLDLVKAKEDHRTAIAEMNGIYGKYLGFLLTEENYANMAAAAHNKVAAAIEREILVKKQLDALNNVDQETQEERTKGSASLAKDLSSIGGLKNNQITRARQDLKDFLKNNFSYDAKKEKIIPSANIWQQLSRQGIEKPKGYQSPEELAALWFNSYLERTFHLNRTQRERITGMTLGPAIDGKRTYSIYRTGFADNLRADYLTAYFDDIRKKGDATDDINDDIKDRDKKINAAAAELANKLVADANASIAKIKKGVEVEGAYSILANSILGLEEQIKSLDSKKDAALINKISQVIATTNQQVDARKLTQAKDKLHASLFEQATWQSEDTTNTNTSSSSKIWGDDEEAASTDWKKMTGKQLVARREQMNKFVNALQNDTDVKAVLAEDAALMKAFKGRQADMRSVIEWYNTERLKIQEELHARHLTNTGDWMDPKKQRQVKNQIKDDMKYYLDELDAYYTERKAKIQDAQNDGEISEAEAQNRTLANEAEWRMRRAELQQLYADKAEKVTSDEQQAIFNIISERTGDTADFVQKDINQTVKFIRAIGEKSRVAMEKIQGSLDKEIEKDFLRRSQAIGKHLDAIQAIIDKERPFNGITKDLQDNLTTMGILTAHLNKERDELMAKNADMTEFNHKQSEEMFKELAFLLRESETAFSTTAEELMQRAAKAGLQAWVDEMKNNPLMQEGLMAQLRSTYDAVQDAIKKEATIIKRHLETQWSDILPGADMSRKDTFEKAISDLGLMGDQVNRANNLISAGTASQRVADKLAIKQLEVQLQMQQVYYAMMQKIGNERVRQLNASAQASKREAEALKKESEELKKQGKLSEAELAALKAQDAERRALNASFDAEYAQKSLNLAKTKELAEEEKQRVAIQNQLEESQNRLYTQLREWAGLLTSSLQSLFEASHAGDAEYYNELAKLNLTGSGGPGAGTYVVIENEGTSDATAHYEYLDQRQALERQREIEQQNAVADAWKKVMDDINMKMSDMITDQLNVMLQNPSIDANTQAVIKNTEAIYASMGMQGGGSTDSSESRRNSESSVTNSSGQENAPVLTGLTADKTQEIVTNIQTIHQADADAAINAAQQVSDATAELPNKAPDLTGLTEERTSVILDNAATLWNGYSDLSISAMQQVSDAMEEIPNKMPNISDLTEEQVDAQLELLYQQNQGEIDINDETYQKLMAMKQKNQQNTVQNDKKEEQSTSSKFAKMAAAANMYGIAYQTMSNDNLSTAQKFQVFALQAAGQAAISMLTMDLAQGKAENLVQMPGILGKLLGEMPYPAAIATFAGITALMGGLMALAMSSVTKSKSQIAQVSGASVGAGRLSTGMLTYAEGNVNEFTDPASLTPGRQYNVDAADGRTYRARYMGNNPKTHLTNGPEFHLSGEKGREMIIDAGTTRQITMNEAEIWHAIQTLSGGGRIAATRRRGGGVRAFADGNVSEFEDMSNMGDTGSMGIATEQTVALQASIDRQSDLLERALTEGIKGVFNVYGKDGLVDSYDRGKKTLNRHGEKY